MNAEARMSELMEFALTTKPVLSNDAAKIAALGMIYIEEQVEAGSQARPHCTFLKKEKLGVIGAEFPKEHGDADKDQFANMIRNLRSDCDVVSFVTEAWVAQYDKSEYEQGSPRLMPRDHPNRKEVGLVHLYLKERMLMFMADIKRKPDSVEPWKLYHDSANSESKMEGRFA